MAKSQIIGKKHKPMFDLYYIMNLSELLNNYINMLFSQLYFDNGTLGCIKHQDGHCL